MGFFSDLKDDLSQAVNELMPEEGAEEITMSAPEEQSAVPVKEPEPDFGADISQMLDNLEPMQEETPKAVEEEPVYAAPTPL